MMNDPNNHMYRENFVDATKDDNTDFAQKRTKTKLCEFVRTFSKISEFAN